ncbi:MAG: hypothetical protein GY866_36450 [Proteobacteria bacterium]|nr:hypothetical protein [Pseudomonadota bacterium]
MHLISTDTYEEAKKVAEGKGLQPKEWRYVTPTHPERRIKLYGYRNVELIGRFTEQERERLNG